MAKKAATKTRKPRTAKKATTAPAVETNGAAPKRGREKGGINKSARVREIKAKKPSATANEIQAELAAEGITLSLPGIYQAMRSSKKVAKKKKTVAIAAKAKASKNGRHHDEHGAVSRFLHAVGELGIDASESLMATIKELTGRR